MGVGEERLSQMSKRYMQLSVFINQFLEAGAAKPGLLDAEYRAKDTLNKSVEWFRIWVG